MRKLVAQLQVAFRAGPIGSAELQLFLEQRGLRRVDKTDIFLACKEHGLAELGEDDRWIPRGWSGAAEHFASSSSSDAASPGMRTGSDAPQPRSASSEFELPGRQRLELDQLRAAVVPPLPEAARRVDQGKPSREWTQFVDEAIQGLDEEFSAVARQRTLNDVPLRGGTVRERGVSRQVVRYEADSEPTAKDGMAATLLLATGTYDVEVISTYGVMVTLAVPLQAQVGGTATLRCDLSYLLAYQARRLRELREPHEDFNINAALELTRPSDSQPERADPYWVGDLNAQQSQAVGQALGEGTTWIWGPPGTGKTRTLAALLAELYAARRRVWLTAPTNMAVDIALVAALREIGEFEPGSIARLGQPALGELRRRETPVLVNELVDLRSTALQQPQADASQDLEQLRARLGSLSRADGDGPEMREIELRIAERQAYVRELEHIRADARRALVANARFVAATAQQALLSALKGQSFDVVVIDEASMLPASLAALAAGAGRGQTIVAGDFRQLPPVVVSPEPKARRWLGRSPFEAAGIDRKVLKGEAPTNLVALKLQHRMPPLLSDAVTAGFYRENPLETAPSVLERHSFAGSSSPRSIVCLDTSALRTRVARRGGVHSRYNLMHALLVAALLDDRELSGSDPALISPFAPQARLLESLVSEDGERGEASTVHRFQGGERDVVVVDAVEAAGGALELHQWFAEGDDGTDGARLVNVAASRARERLIFVADFARVDRSRRRDDALSRFYGALQSEADFLRPSDLVESTGLSDQLDLDQLESDIEAAKDRIEVWSASVSVEAMHALARPLVRAARRGVDVMLWFEPDGQADVPVALQPLRGSDVILRPCLPVRESCAVLDETVWATSGPMLSNIAGHTLRRTHKSLADAVRRMTKRRELGGSTASGHPAGTCARCGRLLVRLEGWRTRASCRSCDARDQPRARPRH